MPLLLHLKSRFPSCETEENWGFFMVATIPSENIAITTDPAHYDIKDPCWHFYRTSMSGWRPVEKSESPDAFFETKRIPFYWLMDTAGTHPVIYTRLKSPVDSNGVHRTWAEHEEAHRAFDIFITNELLQAVAIDTNGIPHIENVPGGLIPRLWSDDFRSLEKMNFDIYSGTNLAHSTLFPVSTAPVAPELTAAEKAAFASWFRTSAATNGAPATNAVLAVFADDDFDGRMDAFASLDSPPDTEGVRPWAFCQNTGDGWLFFGTDAASSVTARTNEFFQVRFNGNDNGNILTHGIVVIQPNPENPVHPLLPRNFDAPLPQPTDRTYLPSRRFITNYDEFFDLYEYLFFRLERIPVESIP
jgi:hypothetical protein